MGPCHVEGGRERERERKRTFNSFCGTVIWGAFALATMLTTSIPPSSSLSLAAYRKDSSKNAAGGQLIPELRINNFNHQVEIYVHKNQHTCAIDVFRQLPLIIRIRVNNDHMNWSVHVLYLIISEGLGNAITFLGASIYNCQPIAYIKLQ